MKLFRVFAASILLVVALVGCKATPTKPGQIVYAGASTYLVALHGATIYKSYPACDAAHTVLLCSDAAVVAKIQSADDRAWPAIQAAEKASQDATMSASDIAKVEAVATDALNYLLSLIPPPALNAAKASVKP